MSHKRPIPAASLSDASATGRSVLTGTAAEGRTALGVADLWLPVDLTAGMATDNGSVTGGSASIASSVATLAHASGLSQFYAGVYSAPHTRLAMPRWQSWEISARIATFTGNAGTVFGFAVGIGAVGYGTINATSRQFFAARVSGAGEVGIFHVRDPASAVLASPVSTPISVADPTTGEFWLSLLRRADGYYVVRWGQGTLVSGVHLPPASDAWFNSAPVLGPGFPASPASDSDAGGLSVAEVLPDAVGAIVYQYTSATAVSCSLAQWTMRRLA